MRNSKPVGVRPLIVSLLIALVMPAMSVEEGALPGWRENHHVERVGLCLLTPLDRLADQMRGLLDPSAELCDDKVLGRLWTPQSAAGWTRRAIIMQLKPENVDQESKDLLISILRGSVIDFMVSRLARSERPEEALSLSPSLQKCLSTGNPRRGHSSQVVIAEQGLRGRMQRSASEFTLAEMEQVCNTTLDPAQWAKFWRSDLGRKILASSTTIGARMPFLARVRDRLRVDLATRDALEIDSAPYLLCHLLQTGPVQSPPQPQSQPQLEPPKIEKQPDPPPLDLAPELGALADLKALAQKKEEEMQALLKELNEHCQQNFALNDGALAKFKMALQGRKELLLKKIAAKSGSAVYGQGEMKAYLLGDKSALREEEKSLATKLVAVEEMAQTIAKGQGSCRDLVAALTTKKAQMVGVFGEIDRIRTDLQKTPAERLVAQDLTQTRKRREAIANALRMPLDLSLEKRQYEGLQSAAHDVATKLLDHSWEFQQAMTDQWVHSLGSERVANVAKQKEKPSSAEFNSFLAQAIGPALDQERLAQLCPGKSAVELRQVLSYLQEHPVVTDEVTGALKTILGEDRCANQIATEQRQARQRGESLFSLQVQVPAPDRPTMIYDPKRTLERTIQWYAKQLHRRQEQQAQSVARQWRQRAKAKFTPIPRSVAVVPAPGVLTTNLVSAQTIDADFQEVTPALRPTGAFRDDLLQYQSRPPAAGTMDQMFSDLAIHPDFKESIAGMKTALLDKQSDFRKLSSERQKFLLSNYEQVMTDLYNRCLSAPAACSCDEQTRNNLLALNNQFKGQVAAKTRLMSMDLLHGPCWDGGEDAGFAKFKSLILQKELRAVSGGAPTQIQMADEDLYAQLAALAPTWLPKINALSEIDPFWQAVGGGPTQMHLTTLGDLVRKDAAGPGPWQRDRNGDVEIDQVLAKLHALLLISSPKERLKQAAALGFKEELLFGTLFDEVGEWSREKFMRLLQNLPALLSATMGDGKKTIPANFSLLRYPDGRKLFEATLFQDAMMNRPSGSAITVFLSEQLATLPGPGVKALVEKLTSSDRAAMTSVSGEDLDLYFTIARYVSELEQRLPDGQNSAELAALKAQLQWDRLVSARNQLATGQQPIRFSNQDEIQFRLIDLNFKLNQLNPPTKERLADIFAIQMQIAKQKQQSEQEDEDAKTTEWHQLYDKMEPRLAGMLGTLDKGKESALMQMLEQSEHPLMKNICTLPGTNCQQGKLSAPIYQGQGLIESNQDGQKVVANLMTGDVYVNGQRVEPVDGKILEDEVYKELFGSRILPLEQKVNQDGRLVYSGSGHVIEKSAGNELTIFYPKTGEQYLPKEQLATALGGAGADRALVMGLVGQEHLFAWKDKSGNVTLKNEFHEIRYLIDASDKTLKKREGPSSFNYLVTRESATNPLVKYRGLDGTRLHQQTIGNKTQIQLQVGNGQTMIFQKSADAKSYHLVDDRDSKFALATIESLENSPLKNLVTQEGARYFILQDETMNKQLYVHVDPALNDCTYYLFLHPNLPDARHLPALYKSEKGSIISYDQDAKDLISAKRLNLDAGDDLKLADLDFGNGGPVTFKSSVCQAIIARGGHVPRDAQVSAYRYDIDPKGRMHATTREARLRLVQTLMEQQDWFHALDFLEEDFENDNLSQREKQYISAMVDKCQHQDASSLASGQTSFCLMMHGLLWPKVFGQTAANKSDPDLQGLLAKVQAQYEQFLKSPALTDPQSSERKQLFAPQFKKRGLIPLLSSLRPLLAIYVQERPLTERMTDAESAIFKIQLTDKSDYSASDLFDQDTRLLMTQEVENLDGNVLDLIGLSDTIKRTPRKCQNLDPKLATFQSALSTLSTELRTALDQCPERIDLTWNGVPDREKLFAEVVNKIDDKLLDLNQRSGPMKLWLEKFALEHSPPQPSPLLSLEQLMVQVIQDGPNALIQDPIERKSLWNMATRYMYWTTTANQLQAARKQICKFCASFCPLPDMAVSVSSSQSSANPSGAGCQLPQGSTEQELMALLTQPRVYEAKSLMAAQASLAPEERLDTASMLYTEYIVGFRLKNEQGRYLQALLRGDAQVAQMVTGFGKSKIFLPILSIRKANGKRLVRVTVPEALKENTRHDLVDHMGKGMLNRVENYSFDVAKVRDPNYLKWHLSDLKNKKENGTIVIASRVEDQKFLDAYHELSDEWANAPAGEEKRAMAERLADMKAIKDFWCESADELIDESDKIWDIYRDYNKFGVGTDASATINAAKLDLATTVMSAYMALPVETAGRFALKDDEYHQKWKAPLIEAVLKRMPDLSGIACAKNYLRAKNSAELDPATNDCFAKLPEAQQLKLGYLNFTLNNSFPKSVSDSYRYKVAYGRRPPHGSYAIPFKSANEPREEGAEFTSPDHVILLTLGMNLQEQQAPTSPFEGLEGPILKHFLEQHEQLKSAPQESLGPAVRSLVEHIETSVLPKDGQVITNERLWTQWNAKLARGSADPAGQALREKILQLQRDVESNLYVSKNVSLAQVRLHKKVYKSNYLDSLSCGRNQIAFSATVPARRDIPIELVAQKRLDPSALTVEKFNQLKTVAPLKARLEWIEQNDPMLLVNLKLGNRTALDQNSNYRRLINEISQHKEEVRTIFGETAFGEKPIHYHVGDEWELAERLVREDNAACVVTEIDPAKDWQGWIGSLDLANRANTQKLQMFVDAASLITGAKSSEVAQYLFTTTFGQDRPVVFWNEKLERLDVYKTAGAPSVPFSTFKKESGQKEPFIFLDRGRSTGTDTLAIQNADLKSLVTLGPDMGINDKTQADGRARKLNVGQSILPVVTKNFADEVVKGLRSANIPNFTPAKSECGSGPDQLSGAHLAYQLYKQTRDQNVKKAFDGAMLEMEHVLKLSIDRELAKRWSSAAALTPEQTQQVARMRVRLAEDSTQNNLAAYKLLSGEDELQNVLKQKMASYGQECMRLIGTDCLQEKDLFNQIVAIRSDVRGKVKSASVNVSGDQVGVGQAQAQAQAAASAEAQAQAQAQAQALAQAQAQATRPPEYKLRPGERLDITTQEEDPQVLAALATQGVATLNNPQYFIAASELGGDLRALLTASHLDPQKVVFSKGWLNLAGEDLRRPLEHVLLENGKYYILTPKEASALKKPTRDLTVALADPGSGAKELLQMRLYSGKPTPSEVLASYGWPAASWSGPLDQSSLSPSGLGLQDMASDAINAVRALGTNLSGAYVGDKEETIGLAVSLAGKNGDPVGLSLNRARGAIVSHTIGAMTANMQLESADDYKTFFLDKLGGEAAVRAQYQEVFQRILVLDEVKTEAARQAKQLELKQQQEVKFAEQLQRLTAGRDEGVWAIEQEQVQARKRDQAAIDSWQQTRNEIDEQNQKIKARVECTCKAYRDLPGAKKFVAIQDLKTLKARLKDGIERRWDQQDMHLGFMSAYNGLRSERGLKPETITQIASKVSSPKAREVINWILDHVLENCYLKKRPAALTDVENSLGIECVDKKYQRITYVKNFTADQMSPCWDTMEGVASTILADIQAQGSCALQIENYYLPYSKDEQPQMSDSRRFDEQKAKLENQFQQQTAALAQQKLSDVELAAAAVKEVLPIKSSLAPAEIEKRIDQQMAALKSKWLAFHQNNLRDQNPRGISYQFERYKNFCDSLAQGKYVYYQGVELETTLLLDKYLERLQNEHQLSVRPTCSNLVQALADQLKAPTLEQIDQETFGLVAVADNEDYLKLWSGEERLQAQMNQYLGKLNFDQIPLRPIFSDFTQRYQDDQAKRLGLTHASIQAHAGTAFLKKLHDELDKPTTIGSISQLP